MRISVALALGGALVAFPVTAAAQDTAQQPAVECLCVLPAEAGSGAAAVRDVQGQVLLSEAVGYTLIESEAELSVGDRLVLLDDGRAVLTGPACRVALAPDSVISLVPTEAGICVATTGAPQLTYNAVPALAGAALSAGGMAAIVLLSRDGVDRPVSP